MRMSSKRPRACRSRRREPGRAPRLRGLGAALRVGAWEILWNDEVPDMVAVAEAVELVGRMSTDDSPGFVNGLLARIAEVKHTLV